MTPFQTIAIVGLGCTGLAVLISCFPRFRRPSLASRLHPYLGALGPGRSRLLGGDEGLSFEGVAGVFRPLLEDFAGRLHRLLPEGSDLPTRLTNAGFEMSPSAFRAQQVTWALITFVSVLTLGLAALSSGRPLSPVMLLASAAVFAAGAVLMIERRLDRAIAARRERMLAEFPTVADLTCLAATVGESVRGALDLVTSLGDGPLISELRAVIRATRTGESFADALGACSRRVGLPPFDRFVEAILTAQERGVPMADALRALAFDVREGQRREVIEEAGKKQIAMLMPVIGLILPVALIFAFFPGLVAIRVLVQ